MMHSESRVDRRTDSQSRFRSRASQKIVEAFNLYHAGEYHAAQQLCQQLLRNDKTDSDAWHILGLCLLSDRSYKDARVALKKAADRDKTNTEILVNYANALNYCGEYEASQAILARVLSIAPNNVQAYICRSANHQKLDQPEAAIEAGRKATLLNPKAAAAWNNLGIALQDTGEIDDAEHCYNLAIELQPTLAPALNNRGRLQQLQGKFAESLLDFDKALGLDPGNAEIWSNRAVSLRHLGRKEDSLADINYALQLDPNNAKAFNNRAIYYLEAGENLRASEDARKALSISPNLWQVGSTLLFSLTQSDEVDDEQVFQEHKAFGALVSAGCKKLPKRVPTEADRIDRPIRVGFISGDFRNHAAAHFFMPLLRNFNKSKFHLYAYSRNAIVDQVTETMQANFHHWRLMAGVNEDILARKIREDRIDVLFDLSGYTTDTGLLALARRPAPVQISWLGYPGTTGIPEVDYVLMDESVKKYGLEKQYTEEILYLKQACTFEPGMDLPADNGLPALKNGYLTLGSFNHPRKINKSTLALWAATLSAIPSAKFVIGAMDGPGTTGRLLRELESRGVSGDRISFRERAVFGEYFKLIQDVDFCLDTVPYTGGTTTHWAIYLGVPTLTMQGSRFSGLQSTSILNHFGLSNWVARSRDDFVGRARVWSEELGNLSKLRALIRERAVLEIELGGALTAREFEFTIKRLWERWAFK